MHQGAARGGGCLLELVVLQGEWSVRGGCVLGWMCYGVAGSVGRVLQPTEGVAEAVGREWVVALVAGMLQQLWEWGGVRGSWGVG